MNIFYGVIILNLEELAERKSERGNDEEKGEDEKEKGEDEKEGSNKGKGKEGKEVSQEVDSAMELENELEGIRGRLERSTRILKTRRIREMIAAVEIDELSVEYVTGGAEGPT